MCNRGLTWDMSAGFRLHLPFHLKSRTTRSLLCRSGRQPREPSLLGMTSSKQPRHTAGTMVMRTHHLPDLQSGVLG